MVQCIPTKYTISNSDSITGSVKSKNSIACGGSEENKEKWDESFSRARATRKKQGQRAPLPLHRNSDGKSCLDFLTFIIYRRTRFTFKATHSYAFRGRVYQTTFVKRE